MSASTPSSSTSSSSSSSSPSSFFSSLTSSWQLLAGAVLAGAGVAYLGYNYKQYSSQVVANEQRKKQKEAKKKAIASTSSSNNNNNNTDDANKPKKEKKKKSITEKSSSGAGKSASTTVVSSDRPSDTSLSTKARSWIDNAQAAGPMIANNSASKSFIEQIRSIAASNTVEELESLYREETRLLLAQVLVIYHTLLAVRMSGENIPGMMSFGPKPSKAEAAQWQNDHKSDMGVAWKLTENIKHDSTSEAGPEGSARSMAMFRLDISQRMKDAEKMSAVFNEMIAMGDSMGDEESMAAFMVAPMLGRWAETRSLGERACGIQSWQEFHQLSLERPEIPDYSELYSMAADIKGPPVPLSDLRWDNLDLINVATQIIEFNAPPEIPRPGPEELKPKDNPIPRGSCILHRMGAIARMIAPSPIGIPLVGPSYPDKFKLTGYAQIEQATGLRAQHRETYDVVLKEHIGAGEGGDNEKWIYTGKYILEQIRESDLSNTLSVQFSVTLTFIKSESIEAP